MLYEGLKRFIGTLNNCFYFLTTICTRSSTLLSRLTIRFTTISLIHLMNNKMNDDRKRKSSDNMSEPNSLAEVVASNGSLCKI